MIRQQEDFQDLPSGPRRTVLASSGTANQGDLYTIRVIRDVNRDMPDAVTSNQLTLRCQEDRP